MAPRPSTKVTAPAKPSKNAKAWAKSHSVFVPPALAGGKSPLVPKRTVVDAVPAPVLTPEQMWEQQRSQPTLAGRVIHGVGTRIASDIRDTLGAAQSGRTSTVSPLPDWLQKGAAVAQPGSDRLVKVTSATADATLGKGIPNLIQGQPPKNFKDIVGLATGVAMVAPVGALGRGTAAGVIEAGKLARAGKTAEEVRAGAKAASKAAYKGKSVTGRVLGKAGEKLKPGEAFHGWTEKQTTARVKSKLSKKNIEKGIPYGNPTIFNQAGIHVAGPVTPQQWVAKVVAAFPTKKLREQWAKWYDHFAPGFHEMFGPERAEEFMRGFAVSQANNSPTGGLLATLRVIDRLMAGDTVETISNKGIGTESLVKTIAKAVTMADGKVDEGVAAKLSDFIDSFLKKKTRTWMGDHPMGGAPAAVDVHAIRDVGMIDKKLVAKMRDVHGLEEGRDFVVDSQGAASGPLYERISEKYQEFADHLNEIAFDGRTDWLPSEAQALGWGATQVTHGVHPEDLMSAFRGNTRTFNLEVTKGINEIGSDLTHEEAARVAEAMRPHVEKIVSETPNVYPVGEVRVGSSAYQLGRNASLHFQVLSSPEAAQTISNRLARVFDQYEVWATKVGGSGAKPTLRIENVGDRAKADAIFQSLYEQNPKRFVGYNYVDGEMHIVLPGKQITVAEQNAFVAEMQPLLDAAEEAAGLERGTLDYSGTNLQIVKGTPDGELQGDRGGLGRESLGHQTDAEARAALERAVADVRAARGSGARGRTRRAVEGLKSEEGSLGVGGGPATGDLEAILANLNPRTLSVNDASVQVGSARSGVSRAMLERPADAVSRAMTGEGKIAAAARAVLPTASEEARAAKYLGHSLVQQAVRDQGRMMVFEHALPRKEGSAEDVAHFWWSQLPSKYRNAEGLQLVRDMQQSTLDSLMTGEWRANLERQLDEVKAELKAYDEDGVPNKLLARKGELELALDDIPYLKEELPLRIARLDKIIANPPAYNPEIVEAVHAFSRDRTATLVRASALHPERAAAREGLVSSWLGLEPTGEEAYIGHRYGDVKGARTSLLPGGLGTGRPRLPQGVSKRNELVLAATGRVRESTHVALDDWRASRVFERAVQQRVDLGNMGVAFRPGMRLDPKTEILVNPKGRPLPQQWRSGDPLEALADGTEEEVRAAAEELVKGYVSDPKLGQASFDEVLAQAERDGVRWTDLRVVKRSTAERYAAQFKTPVRAGGKLGTAAAVYDHVVDGIVASIVFARIGYIPKNVVQNLIMAVPHQGVFFVANAPRAGQVLKDAQLRHLFEAEVGFSGPTIGLAEESTATKALKAPHGAARLVGGIADNPLRFTALIHELAALNVIPKLKPVLSDADKANLLEVFTNPRYRPILDAARNRSVEAMADFSRLTPTQRKWSRRFLIIPGWLWAGSRYPVKFAASYPGRTAAGAYVAAGEPYGDRAGLPQNRPITDYMAEGLPDWMQGIETPAGVFRTSSISPISTPIEIARAASQRDAQTVGDYANPLGASLWNVANRQVDSPTGAYRASFGTALARAGERLVPNYGLARDLVHPNDNSKYYPGDATRRGRLEREIGVVPIEVNRNASKKAKKHVDRARVPFGGGSSRRRSSRPSTR